MRNRLAWSLLALSCACAPDRFTGSDAADEAGLEAGAEASGGEASTGEGGSPLFGANEPGLALWLDAKNAVVANGRVSSWPDSSPNHNDAVSYGVTGDPEPASDSINGLPGIHFTGTDPYQLVVPDTPTMRWGVSDFFVLVVAEFQNDPASQTGNGFGCLFSKGTTSETVVGPALYGNVPGAASNAPGAVAAITDGSHAAVTSTPYNDHNGHIFGIERTGDNLVLRVDRKAVATVAGVAGVNVDALTATGRIGSLVNGTSGMLDGDIDEIIAVSGTTVSARVVAVEAYLAAKYNL
jgi:hypothetical protein